MKESGMRLRQVALVSGDMDAVTRHLDDVFGLKVAYNDPHIHHYGLKNAVLPAGAAFLEVVQPVRDDASAARHLKRRGGDAGYMVILQVANAPAEQTRAEKLGVRVVDKIDRRDYYCAHFHPADFGGMLVSFDQQRSEADFLKSEGDWMPAGPDWRRAQSREVRDITSLTLSASDPVALARRWSELVGRPLDRGNSLRLPLDHGEIRFVQGESGGPTLITRLDVKVNDAKSVLARATTAKLDITDDGILIGGIRFQPISA
jgi:hypothetical protein